MNGYHLSDFPEFSKTWQLVTVRHRGDTNELRFTYANDIAWSQMSSGETDYSDGAVFAKVSFVTREDLAFPSSKVPGNQRRIQFMVRNKELHKETAGWGYAIFSPDGLRQKGNVRNMSMACAACHKLVKDRGHVFSQPMPFLDSNFRVQTPSEGQWQNRVRFNKINRENLPTQIAVLLEGHKGPAYQVSSESLPYVFHGTLDEIRPLLIKQVIKGSAPSYLYDEKSDLFAVVKLAPQHKCPSDEVALLSAHSVPNPKKPVFELPICYRKPAN
ncbi:MAG: cytochrome P460 family protein [Bdellovibrionales bacterium]|nr:cytochrome P460 family protein [Bdellovibrionales bacterium]